MSPVRIGSAGSALALAVGLMLVDAGRSAAASATAAIPRVEGPISGGSGKPIIGSTAFDLAEVGYSEREYFVSGTATAMSVGTWTSDGKWTATPAGTAAYKTRIVVYRPTDAKKFNGTTVVEWLNVSGGGDGAAEWITSTPS